MIDLAPAPVPELSDEWITARRQALVDAVSERPRRPLRWAALSAATGVAATISSLVLVGGSEPYAFAGWSASPTSPASGQLTAAAGACEAALSQAEQLRPSNKGAFTGAASFTPELSDVRGPYTVTLFGSGGPGAVLCVSTPSSTSLRWIDTPSTPLNPGSISVDKVSVLAREGQPYTLVEGRTGVGVSAVTLNLGDGSEVSATAGGGFFAAWWPGSEVLSSARVTTPTGSSTQTLNVPAPQVPTPPKSAPTQPATHTSCTQTASVACGR